MKKYILIPVLALLFLGCKEQKKGQKTQAPVEVEVVAEKNYADDQFRRFTFFVESENPKVAEQFKSMDWEALSKNSNGIRTANAYQKDNGIFFVFDADPNYNSETLIETLNADEKFSSLATQLEAEGVDWEKYNQPLERIFKMAQKKEYSPEEGQLKTEIGRHKRFVWTLLLQEDPEMMAEYKRIHSMGQAWPQVIENMKTMGIKDMELYLYGTRAMLIMDTRPGFDMAVDGPKWQKLPREMEWQEYVSKFQRTEPGSGIQEKWLDMEEL